MSNTVKEQLLHNKLLIIQAINYKKQGYTDIKVINTNSTQGQPIKVGNYTPDLSASLDHNTTICSIETNDSITDIQTINKWRAFDRSGMQFHLLVPHDSFDLVKEIAKSNGISIDKYWFSKNY